MDSLPVRVGKKLRERGLAGVAGAVRNRVVEALTRHPIVTALGRLERQAEAAVIQVGAYVGPSYNDPLHEFLRQKAGRGLTAVLVEPVADYFARLADAYRDTPGVYCVNAAVAETSGPREFYRLGVDPRAHGMPDWLEQLGSLRADRMGEAWDRCEADPRLKAFWAEHRVVDRVECLTLADLMARHAIGRLDLLQIDAEGYDGAILRSIDFTRSRPRYINYERVLLGRDEEAGVRSMLRAAGYRLSDYGQDTFCSLPRNAP